MGEPKNLGRRYTGESSECSSLVGTPTESGRCFTFTAVQRLHRAEERKPSVNQNLSEMLLDVSVRRPGMLVRGVHYVTMACSF